jgi:osmoprotectant transport system ATP-binding protein
LPGSIVALLGQSGCGKSTLLRVITGVVQPCAGAVLFSGEEVFSASTTNISPERREHIRHTIGYMIQDGGLFPHLTAEQNILLIWQYLRRSSTEAIARIKDLCALTKFPADALSRYPAQLSGGQRQRVALMRALMLNPALLLLDEPFAALDPIIRHDLQDDVKRIVKALGKTLLLVTHDVSEAAFFADRMVIMDGGQILQQGTFQEIRTKPAHTVVERFFSVQRAISTS